MGDYMENVVRYYCNEDFEIVKRILINSFPEVNDLLGKSLISYKNLELDKNKYIQLVIEVDGKVVSGKHGHAGEIANLIIDRNRAKVNHLNAGAVECEASGTAITRKGKEIFGEEIEHAGHVFDKARQGDEKALEMHKKYTERTMELKKEDEESFGPLTHESGSGYEWIKDPWPWEYMECGC